MRKRLLMTLDDPFFSWTEESTRNYILSKPIRVGDQMIIYNGQAGLHEYQLAIVENPDSGRQHRIILSNAAAWGGCSFYRSGKNCYSPTGQSRMIPPVPEIMEHIALDCDLFIEPPTDYLKS